MQKLDNRRAAYAMLPVGAENTFTQRLSAPDRAVCHFCSNAENHTAFNAGSIPKYKTAHAGIGCGRLCTVFSAPGFFSYPRKRIRRKSYKFITGSEKADIQKGHYAYVFAPQNQRTRCRTYGRCTVSDKNLISTDRAALMLGVKKQTLANWRSQGKGPAYVRISANCVKYDPAEVRAFIKARRRDGKNAR